MGIVMQNKVPETSTVFKQTYCFKNDQMDLGTSYEELLTEDIKHISHFTLNTEITLISVFDSDGNSVTEKYNQKNDIKLQMNEEQKNDNNDFQKQIDKISKKLLLNG